MSAGASVLASFKIEIRVFLSNMANHFSLSEAQYAYSLRPPTSSDRVVHPRGSIYGAAQRFAHVSSVMRARFKLHKHQMTWLYWQTLVCIMIASWSETASSSVPHVLR